MPVGRQKEVKDEKKIFEEGRLTHLKLTFYFDVAISFAMLPQEKRVKRKREDADANANADGRHAGVSDNNVVHVEAEAHVTRPTDATEQAAGSGEGVKKNKKRHSPSDLVNVERKDDDRDAGAGDDDTSGQGQSDGMLPPRGNTNYRRHVVRAIEDVDGPLSPKTPMQLRTLPKHTTPIALNQSLGQSTTMDPRDEKSAEDDDDEDELITIRSPQRPSPRNRAEERSRTDWELLIRDKFAQSLRAGLEDNMTLQQAAAFAKEEFISSLQYMDLHQLGEVTAFGISIMNQVKSQILACKYITEAQRFAILVKTLPVTGNTMVFVIAMQELLIDMVAHAARHGTDELSDKWKQTTAYSLGSARVVWQSFLDDGLVQQSKPASNAHIVQWSEKQVEEFSDKRVRREIEQLTHTVQELKKEPREHEFLRWLLGMGGVVVSLQETRTSMPLHERVWRELSAEIRLKTPERWSAINEHMHTATTPYPRQNT